MGMAKRRVEVLMQVVAKIRRMEPGTKGRRMAARKLAMSPRTPVGMKRRVV